MLAPARPNVRDAVVYRLPDSVSRKGDRAQRDFAMRIRLSEIDGASAVLAQIAEKVTARKPLNAALGKRGEVELRAHFEQRNTEGNTRGWPSQQFWARIRTATAFASADESSARVVIADPAINQKIFDGTITPKERKYLALPAIAEAYGRSPRVLPNLTALIRWRDGQRRAVALVERAATEISFGRKRKDGSRKVTPGESRGGRVWYWLVKSVTQRRDDRALPDEKAFSAALIDEAKEYLDRL
jgi:hypothetical protein